MDIVILLTCFSTRSDTCNLTHCMLNTVHIHLDFASSFDQIWTLLRNLHF